MSLLDLTTMLDVHNGEPQHLANHITMRIKLLFWYRNNFEESIAITFPNVTGFCCAVSTRNISNFNSIRLFPKLKRLQFHKDVDDLSFLPDLKNLVGLDFYRCRIHTDLSILRLLPNLRKLYLADTRLSRNSLVIVSNLENLEELDISNTLLDSVPELQLHNLTHFWAGGNKLTNLDFLNKCTKLVKIDISTNQITNLSGIKDAKKLRRINCNCNPSIDLSEICNFHDLEEIFCSWSKISDLTPLSNLKKLKVLIMDNNHIINLEPIRLCEEMRVLSMNNNLILDLDPLRGFNKLYKIFLNNNQITNLEPLSNCLELEIIEVDHNLIADLI